LAAQKNYEKSFALAMTKTKKNLLKQLVSELTKVIHSSSERFVVSVIFLQ
jgi:hypothetical protein